MAYGYLWFSEDIANQDALTFHNRVEQFGAEMQNRMLFFDLWWKALEDDAAVRLMANSGDVRYFLESLRLFKPHTLSEPEEKIINIKDVNGINAVKTIYEMLTNAFKYHLTVDGEEKELTRGQLMFLRHRPQCRPTRRRLPGTLPCLRKPRPTCWRTSTPPASATGRPNNSSCATSPAPSACATWRTTSPTPSSKRCWTSSAQNVTLFQRFFRFKASALNVKRLRRYDLYAPLSEVEKTYTFDAAVRMVDASYRAFSPTLADQALRVIDAQHLDSEIRPRKMGGAYCYGPLPELTPWVQMNFQGGSTTSPHWPTS